MTAMATEPAPGGGGGGGNFLTQKYAGIPGVVWMAGAAALAYFLFFRNKSAQSGGGTSTGGGGQASTGDIAFTPGTTTLDLSGAPAATVTNPAPVSSQSGSGDQDVGQPSQTGTPNPQPTPTPPPRQVQTHTSVTYTNYIVQKGDTLAALAKRYGISVATLAHANTYVAGELPGNAKVGQPLGTGAGLKTGQVLKIPHIRTTTS